MLDEQALRRSDFVDGVVIVLADGQGWQLRRPVVRFAPADNDVGFEVRMTLCSGDEYNDLVSRHEQAATPAEQIAAELALGRAVLLGNYNLTATEVGSLLQFGWGDGDPEGRRIREQVMDVALGNDPKALDGGGVSSPTPPG